MAAQDDCETALIDAYLELWQRNLIAFASEAAPEAMVVLASRGIAPHSGGDPGPQEEPS